MDENFEERTLKKQAQGHIVSDCPNLDSAWVFFIQKVLAFCCANTHCPTDNSSRTHKGWLFSYFT